MAPQFNRGRGQRGRPHHRRGQHRDQPTEPKTPSIPPQAYVQAYEAQLVYGQQARAREMYTVPDSTAESSTSRRGRSALMRWEGDDERDIWVDRYDILHLMSSLPEQPAPIASNPREASPAPTSSSWDSIPSDAEDTWYLSSEAEYEEYERSKKRRWMEALREERLREREKEDVRQGKEEAGYGAWEGDDEEPPAAIRTLMTHTAASLAKSPNPSLLEMRILANHSTDDRFSFLRGRYKSTWIAIKRAALPEVAAKGASLLGGYGSESDSGSDQPPAEVAQPPDGSPPPPPPASPPPSPPPH